MKKILLILIVSVFVFLGNYSFAEDTENSSPTVLEASIQFDWLNMEQAQRDAKIKYFHERLFSDGTGVDMNKKTFRTTYGDFLKDKNYKTHYRLISNGVQEVKDFNLSGFFKNYKSTVILYSYAMQPKKDLKHIYYYSAFGTLAYMDILEGDYPNFPYISRQYKSNGKLAGVIYFENHDLQYLYKPNGEFKGLWFKDKMYDAKAKEILSRSNW